jgi:hypothetical protein
VLRGQPTINGYVVTGILLPKFGWNDMAAKFLARVKAEDGSEHRTDIVTTFDLIDLREGREHEKPSDAERDSHQPDGFSDQRG